MDAETIKNWTEAFAWGCAGLFFLYKAFSGYLISNLSLSLSCQREHSASAADWDHLVVTGVLKKGDRGAVSLHDVRVHVLPTVKDEPNAKPLIGVNRLSSRNTGPEGIWKILEAPSKEAPLLNLPPGEEATFSQYFKVPAGEPCAIDVTVLGGWRWHQNTRYQWRSSTISLPVKTASTQT